MKRIRVEIGAGSHGRASGLPLHLANESRLLEGIDTDQRHHLATTLATVLEAHGDTPARGQR